MKRGLVLAGGGTKGIYQAGCLKALRDLKLDQFDLVIGVSVGALNAAMIVQGELDELEEMYDHLDASQIVNGFLPSDTRLRTLFNERQELMPQIQHYIKEGSIDIRPFYDMVEKYFNPDKFFSSNIDFGCVTALKKDKSGVYITKEMMKDKWKDWLVASASAYPAFPIQIIDGVEYIDGGYYDNCPVDYALQQGCDEIVVLDLNAEPQHRMYQNIPFITYIHPHSSLYNFLTFDQEQMQKAKLLGYNDTMKAFGKYVGIKYTFEPFALPEYTNDFIKELLLLEIKIKQASNITTSNRSESHITDLLKQESHHNDVNVRFYIYSILDHLMELLGLDETKVYQFNDVMEILKESFKDASNEDFQYKPSFLPTEIAGYLSSFDEKSLITTLLHGLLYKEHRFVSENIILNYAPLEAAFALFVSYIFQGESK